MKAAFWSRHRLLAFTGVIAMASLVAAVIVPAAWRSAGSEVSASDGASSLLTLVNQARASSGLASLDYASDLSAIAAQRASVMAKSESLAHTADLGGQVCCWSWIGENVAYAGSIQSLHDVLMNSPEHRANILNADADDIGVAVVSGGGQLWAAQVFRARSDDTRATDAVTESRGDERVAPTSPGTSSAPPTDASGPSRAELLRQQLSQAVRTARDHLRAERRKHGPLDPVRAAVRYTVTLDEVSR